MVNAWSLADSVLNGTLDEDYPIMFITPKTASEDPDGGMIIDGRYSEVNLNIEGNLPDEELKKMSERKQDGRYKYHEHEIINDIEDYISSTYNGHYTGNTHEYRNVQTLDLMAARDVASGFCQANILKYGSRYGSKDGKNKKDLMKVIHYAMLLLHFDEHYGKPKMTSGNIDHNMP